MGDMTKNFNRSEFTCKCGCGKNNISPGLVNMLQIARDLLGLAMYVNSGCRCDSHNEAVGGAPDSSHLDGEATDVGIRIPSLRYRHYHALHKAGFRRFGHGEGLIHVDISSRKPSPRMWVY